ADAEHPHRRPAWADHRRRGRGGRAGGGDGAFLRREEMGSDMTSAAGRLDPVRVGVIGTGAMGAAHVENLARWVPGATVAQVFDVDSERAKQIAESVGAAVAPSAEGLIDADDVDAVLIAAPDPLHEPLAIACVELGKPALLEKPIASTLEGGRRV